MSVELSADRIRLFHHCEVEEAEDLLQAVRANPELPVDVSDCRWMHTAVFQVLFCLNVRVIGSSADNHLEAHVLPLLARSDQPQAREAE